jgi:AcrR family transcriptional regulator
MDSDATALAPAKLTSKGQATRARILEHAAQLIYANGVHGTNNEQLRRAAGVSGSQLNHYFPTKESLVLAVIQWQADRVLSFHRSERFRNFDSIDSLQEWADYYVEYSSSSRQGCSLGSLASEIIKTELDVRQQLKDAFGDWHAVFRDGLERMKAGGRLRADADSVRLANSLLAAYQGGVLLSQIAGDAAPLRDSLQAAIDHVRSYT